LQIRCSRRSRPRPLSGSPRLLEMTVRSRASGLSSQRSRSPSAFRRARSPRPSPWRRPRPWPRPTWSLPAVMSRCWSEHGAVESDCGELPNFSATWRQRPPPSRRAVSLRPSSRRTVAARVQRGDPATSTEPSSFPRAAICGPRSRGSRDSFACAEGVTGAARKTSKPRRSAVSEALCRTRGGTLPRPLHLTIRRHAADSSSGQRTASCPLQTPPGTQPYEGPAGASHEGICSATSRTTWLTPLR
jgi:hypothetical protein